MSQHLLLHHGARLKEIVKAKKLTVPMAVQLMGLSNNQHLHYYYNKQQIKTETLQTFLQGISSSMEEFLDVDYSSDSMVNEDAPTYKLGVHHGRNLKNIIKAKNINMTGLCKTVNISRHKLYTLFSQAHISNGDLFELAKAMEVPMARIKGIDVKDTDYEKEILNEVSELKNRIDILNKLLAK